MRPSAPASRTQPLRVLITDDSAIARQLLREFLESDPMIQIVGEAENGRESIELNDSLRPDLITMDLEMPLMGGLEAIGNIMARRAVPILVVTHASDAENAGEAVMLGALEVVRKPDFDADNVRELTSRVRMLARVPVIRRDYRPKTGEVVRSPALVPDARASAPAALSGRAANAVAGSQMAQRIIAIASSTGGTQALAKILPSLPADFLPAIVIAQHTSPGFAQGLAKWLAGLCKLPVVVGEHEALILAGHVYIAPPETDMAVTPGRRIALLKRGDAEIYRPNCDVLLNSVAKAMGERAIGVVLSGMGRDGAQGIASIHAEGGLTLAQDEATSVVFGMNQQAIQTGAVDRILPLDEIAGALAFMVGADD